MAKLRVTAMVESIAAVLESRADDPARFAQLARLLDDPSQRLGLEDYLEGAIRRESARYTTAMLDRAEFYSQLVKREVKRLRGKEQLDALAMMNEQFPRIVETIEHEMNLEDSTCLAKFAASIVSLLHMQGKLELGAAVFQRLLKQAKKAGNRPLEIKAGRYYGQFLTEAGKLDNANEITYYALGLALLEGNESELAKVQIALGNVTRYQGRYEESMEFYRQALEHGKDLGDKYLVSGALCSLGLIALEQQRLDDARQLFAESLEIARETGNIYRIAGDLHNLACVSYLELDYSEAKKHLLEALELNRLIGNRVFEARNLNALGRVALELGCLEEARELFTGAQSVAAETGNEREYARCEKDLQNVAAASAGNGNGQRLEKAIQVSRATPYCSCDWR